MEKQRTMVRSQKGLFYQLDSHGKPLRFKPWLGDLFAFAYDSIMERSIFPKKFEASMEKHASLVRSELESWEGKEVLELGAGSGSAAEFLPPSVAYAGLDISPGLLRRGARKFRARGFSTPLFYVASAEELPVEDERFDCCLCLVSLNFFPDIPKVLKEVHRVLRPGGTFFCVVPVPERNAAGSTIRGTLLSQKELEDLCWDQNLRFEALPHFNGALLYFRAEKLAKEPA